MSKYLSYDNILLSPRYSTLESRDLADTTVDLCGYNFKLPVCPANMEDVINVKISEFLSNNGYFYIYHRFGKDSDDSIDSNLNTVYFTKLANKENWKLISVSTGVNEDSLKELLTIKALRLRVDFICIDVAHAWHIKVKDRIGWIKENLPNSRIVAGNVANYTAYLDLSNWGADAIKVGIGQGSICTTRFQTGFSVPMFSCIEKIEKKIREENTAIKTPIIADGGIKYSGDIAKALVAGATMVMTGKLFASCIDSPAQIIDNKKQYRGSTSFAAKKHNKHIEGRTIDLEADITIKERLQEIKESLSSSISYGGGNNLECFKKVDWLEV
jgi:GMP reductase